MKAQYTLEKSTYLLSAILAVVMLSVITITTLNLYNTALEQGRERLTETVQSQARLIEAVARFDSQYSQTDVPGGAEQATLLQIREAHGRYKGFGETGEFTLAKFHKKHIHFLLQHRKIPIGSDLMPHQNIMMGSDYAIPMQLALSGKSGTVIDRDYQGVMVLAAFEPVSVLNYGIVAKIDLTEIQAPFWRAGLFSFAIGSFFIVIGTIGFHLVTRPMIRAIHKSERNFRLLLDSAGEGIYGIDLDGNCTFANPSCVQLLGYESDQGLIGQNMHQKIHHHHQNGDVYPIEECKIFKAFRQKKGVSIDDEVLWRKDGTFFPAKYSSNPIFESEKCIGAVISFSDISRIKEAENQHRLTTTVFENVDEGIIVTDRNAKIISVNDAFCNITMYSADEVIGKNPRILQSGRHDSAFYEELWRTLIEKGTWQGEVWNRKKNGEIYPEWETISMVKDENDKVTHYVAAFSDISVLKSTERRLYHLAHHDPLTDLPNRLLFTARFVLSIQKAERDQSLIGVFFIDLDGFKDVNDQYGHEAGDSALVEIASRLSSLVRQEDTVCRLGGDEFAILMVDIKDKKYITTLADKIYTEVKKPFEFNRNTVAVSCSIGISTYPDDGSDMDSLLRNADSRMYRAKASGEKVCSLNEQELGG